MQKLSLLLSVFVISCATASRAPVPDPARAHQLTKDQKVEVYVKGSDGKLYPATVLLRRGAWCAEDSAVRAKE